MISRLKPKNAFILAIGLMLGSALLAAFTIYQLSTSEYWVRHTYRTLLDIGNIQSNMGKAGRIRKAVLDLGSGDLAKDFADTRRLLGTQLQDLHRLTADNPEQQSNSDELRESVNGRLKLLQQSMDSGGTPDSETQRDFTDRLARTAFETAEIADRMEEIEQRLLDHRRVIASSFFIAIVCILVFAFVLSIFLFRMYYKLLSEELRERKLAEQNAQALSTALMRVQDEERRKFSRELHDSLSQLLVGAKMVAADLAKSVPGNASVSELEAMLDDALKETRTLSHLLHPPLLDEIGFAPAARWFTENYSQRTGIAVEFECPDSIPDIPKNLELVMFRVMQESLTNARKHSRATTTRVCVTVQNQSIRLEVKDNGVGIPAEKLEAFLSQGSGVGIGLAGIKQRVKEQSGTLSIDSGTNRGTNITVAFSLASPSTLAGLTAANS